MKRSLILCVFLIAIAALSAKERIIENPHFSVGTHGNVVVKQVTLTDDSTLLHMVIGHSPSSWIRIDSKTYIQVDGKKYIVESAEGIELDKEVYSDQTNKTHFTLKFPAIDSNAQTLDFIETDCDDCFKIWGINLDPNATFVPSEIPQHIKDLAEIREDGKGLEIPRLEEGIAILKGVLLGYTPQMNLKVQAYVNNPVTGIQEELETQIREDGTFELEVSLPVAMEVFLRFYSYSRFILLSPGEESTFYFDLHQKSYQETMNDVLRRSESKYIFWSGANAEINNQMEDLDLSGILRSTIYSEKNLFDILGMDGAQYKAYIWERMQDAIERISDRGLTKKAKEFVMLSIRNEVMYRLYYIEHDLREAYRRANKLSYEDDLSGFEKPVLDIGYYSFFKELDLNNSMNLYSGYFSTGLNAARYLRYCFPQEDLRLEADFYQNLMKTQRLTPEELEIAQYLIKAPQENTFDTARVERVIALHQKFDDDIRLYFDLKAANQSVKYLAQILGTSEGIVFDLITAQTICGKLEEYVPLTVNDLQVLGQIDNPFYLQYATKKNDELVAKLERKKDTNTYTVHDTPESEGEQFFTDIIKPFEGKVVMIDFWATWCGPCRSAMKQFESAKEELKKKGVVFVYLTDESSPLKAWENMIQSIAGEHFRMTSSQFTELKKRFGVKGIPSYLILNKKGEQVYFSVGFAGTNKLTQILNDELNK